MADTKTTGLDELTVAAAADLLYIIDDVAGTPTGKKITVANLAANLGAIAGTGITLTGGTVTDNAPLTNGSQTWNDVTKTFVLDSMNVTDTASAAASLLWERKRNSQRKHQFTKTGLEIFNSWTSDSVYERAFFRWESDSLRIGTEHVGANARNIFYVAAGTTHSFSHNGGANGSLSLINGVANFFGNITANSAGLSIGSTTVPFANFFLSGYNELVEMTAPAAPAANKVRLFAEDNGSGKTRLMAIFPTGAAVQVAIEP